MAFGLNFGNNKCICVGIMWGKIKKKKKKKCVRRRTGRLCDSCGEKCTLRLLSGVYMLLSKDISVHGTTQLEIV